MPIASLSTGAILHYEDVGVGQPLILLHGLLGTARVDLGDVIDRLSTDYRVLGVTMRGYGQSLPKPRAFPLDFYQQDAHDVLAFMDAVGLERAFIGGYSDGGEVALLAATMQPKRFPAVLTWGSIGVLPPELLPEPDNLGTVPGVDDLVEVARSLHGIQDPQPVIKEWVQTFTTLIRQGGDLSLSQAQRLTMPVLLILGDNDPMAPLPYAENFVAHAPNAHLHVVFGGHAVHQEHLEHLLTTVRDFIIGVVPAL
jgi:pimeloyl-ACP methyl ester carboxylesterase